DRAQRPQFRCLFRLLERAFGAGRELAGAIEPEQLARRRREAAMTRRSFPTGTFLGLFLALLMPGLAAQTGQGRTFATPEAAVQVLIDTVKAGNLDDLIAIFGHD